MLVYEFMPNGTLQYWLSGLRVCVSDRHVLRVIRLYSSSESTNQRIQFDIEPSDRHLGIGDQDGLICIYDLQTRQWVSSFQIASETRSVASLSIHIFRWKLLHQGIEDSGCMMMLKKI